MSSQGSIERLIPFAGIVLAVGLLWLSAQVQIAVPGATIRHSPQTLAVIVVGALLGWRLGALAVVMYLLVGLAGAPVFSHGGSGWLHLSGPTGGFLAGFVLAAALSGRWLEQDGAKSIVSIFTVCLLAHIVILFAGWLGLLNLAGPLEAYQIGILPFMDGALLKSVIATALLLLLALIRPLPWRRRYPPVRAAGEKPL